MPPDNDVIAGGLVGGQSRRFGSAKFLLRVPEGGTLVERVVDVAGRVAGEVVLLGAADAIPASLSALTVLPDERRDMGPCAGLASLLRHAGSRWALLMSCDLPLMTPELLRRLIVAREGADDVVGFARGDGAAEIEPCCALYHPRLLRRVESLLAQGPIGLRVVLRDARVKSLPVDVHERHLLSDIDTPEDAKRLLGEA